MRDLKVSLPHRRPSRDLKKSLSSSLSWAKGSLRMSSTASGLDAAAVASYLNGSSHNGSHHDSSVNIAESVASSSYHEDPDANQPVSQRSGLKDSSQRSGEHSFMREVSVGRGLRGAPTPHVTSQLGGESTMEDTAAAKRRHRTLSPGLAAARYGDKGRNNRRGKNRGRSEDGRKREKNATRKDGKGQDNGGGYTPPQESRRSRRERRDKSRSTSRSRQRRGRHRDKSLGSTCSRTSRSTSASRSRSKSRDVSQERHQPNKYTDPEYSIQFASLRSLEVSDLELNKQAGGRRRRNVLSQIEEAENEKSSSFSGLNMSLGSKGRSSARDGNLSLIAEEDIGSKGRSSARGRSLSLVAEEGEDNYKSSSFRSRARSADIEIRHSGTSKADEAGSSARGRNLSLIAEEGEDNDKSSSFRSRTRSADIEIRHSGTSKAEADKEQRMSSSMFSFFGNSDNGGLQREDTPKSIQTEESDDGSEAGCNTGEERRRPSRRHSKKKNGRKDEHPYDEMTPVEKLKLAKSKLDKKEKDKDFINLLESSIQDLQAAEWDDKKSKRHRSRSSHHRHRSNSRHHHRSRGKSTDWSRSNSRSQSQDHYYDNERDRSKSRHRHHNMPANSNRNEEEAGLSRVDSRSHTDFIDFLSGGGDEEDYIDSQIPLNESLMSFERQERQRSSSNHSRHRRKHRSRGNSESRSRSRSKHDKSRSNSMIVSHTPSSFSELLQGISVEERDGLQPAPKSGVAPAPIPKGATKALDCIRGSEALPRENVVSEVVRRLVSSIDCVDFAPADEDDDEKCVAIISPSSSTDAAGIGGVGKTTIAALACIRADVRTRYHKGIAWIDMENNNQKLDVDRYANILSDICRQLGVNPQKLKLNPVIRIPGEDEAVASLRMERHMKEARARMGWVLSALQKKRRGKRDHEENQTVVLIVLDDVASPSDIEWFQFRRKGKTSGVKINDLLITSKLTSMPSAMTVVVPQLEKKEALRLLLIESDLPRNHPLMRANNDINLEAQKLVKDCMFHPLTIKFAGRWVDLKRATSQGQKGMDEILGEVRDAIAKGMDEGGDKDGSNNSAVDVLYALLSKAMSPLVRGDETRIIRLCFAALIDVFYTKETYPSTSPANSSPPTPVSVPLEITNGFFLNVVNANKDILMKDDALFQANGKHASKLVSEILGALGVFNITKHGTQVGKGGIASDQKRGSSSIQVDHELVQGYSRHLHDDTGMSQLVRDNSTKVWNEAYVQSYLQQKRRGYTWDDIQHADRSREYALKNMPMHMMRAEMNDDFESLMLNTSFIRGRFWLLRWTKGTRVHVNDTEAFCKRMMKQAATDKDSWSKLLVDVCLQLESVLMEEVARESGGPNGRCSTLEAGQCLNEISLSLARFRLWDEASRFCHLCVKLVESNLGPSDLVASLLYNDSIMHMEGNEYKVAKERITECLDMRGSDGIESIFYARAQCQLGDILSLMSDYAEAESCYIKSLDILKVIPSAGQCALDYGVAIYKLGRNQHRRGGEYLDEALHCYEMALDIEKEELGSSHVFIFSILMHVGDLLLEKKEDSQQAIRTYKKSLDVLHDVLTEAEVQVSASYFELNIKFTIVEGKVLSILGQSDECIEKYQHALTLIQKYSPFNRRKMSQVYSLIGAEHEKNDNYGSADQFYEKSVDIMKSLFGPFHLDVADISANVSRVKGELECEVQKGASNNMPAPAAPLSSSETSEESVLEIEDAQSQDTRVKAIKLRISQLDVSIEQRDAGNNKSCEALRDEKSFDALLENIFHASNTKSCDDALISCDALLGQSDTLLFREEESEAWDTAPAGGRKEFNCIFSASLREDAHINDANIARWSDVESCQGSTLAKLGVRPQRVPWQRRKNNVPELAY